VSRSRARTPLCCSSCSTFSASTLTAGEAPRPEVVTTLRRGCDIASRSSHLRVRPRCALLRFTPILHLFE
jgi:hypothetical protein